MNCTRCRGRFKLWRAGVGQCYAFAKETLHVPSEERHALRANDACEEQRTVGLARAVRRTQQGQDHLRVVKAF